MDLRLISSNSLIQTYIENTILPDKPPPQESRCRKTCRVGLKILFGLGLAALAPIPDAPLSISYSNGFNLRHKEILGGFMVVGNSLYCFFQVLYSTCGFIDAAMAVETDEERQIKNQRACCAHAVICIASLVLGFASSAPQAYITWYEDKENFLMPFFSFITDTPLVAYSMFLSISLLLSKATWRSSVEKGIDTIAQKLSRRCEEAEEEIDKQTFSLHDAPDFQESGPFMQYLIKKEYQPPEKTDESCSALKVFGALVGLVATATQFAHVGKVSYEASKDFQINDKGAIPIAIISVLLQAYLISTIYVKTGAWFFQKSGQILCDERKVGLVEKTFPKSIYSLTLFSIVCACFSFGQQMYAAREFFETRTLELTIGISNSVGAALFLIYTMQNMIEPQIENFIQSRHYDTVHSLNFKNRLRRLQQILTEAKRREKARFLLTLEEDQFDTLKAGLNITTEDVREYLKPNYTELGSPRSSVNGEVD